jgi:hypothetical protein
VRREAEVTTGGCIIGNLSTELSDTHEAFRDRLAECFDEMAQEFLPHLEAAARQREVSQRRLPRSLAQYIVTVIEGAIMQPGTGPGQTGMNMETYLAKMFNHGAYHQKANEKLAALLKVTRNEGQRRGLVCMNDVQLHPSSGRIHFFTCGIS